MDRSPLKTFLIKFLVSCQNSLPTAIRSHGCHQIQTVTHPSYRWCGTSGAGSPASSSSGPRCSPPTPSTLSGAIQINFITFWVGIIDTALWLQFSRGVLSRWMGKHFTCLRTIMVHLKKCCFQDSILYIQMSTFASLSLASSYWHMIIQHLHLNENIPKCIHADKNEAVDVPPGYLSWMKLCG
jgi:hypothetical protein